MVNTYHRFLLPERKGMIMNLLLCQLLDQFLKYSFIKQQLVIVYLVKKFEPKIHQGFSVVLILWYNI